MKTIAIQVPDNCKVQIIEEEASNKSKYKPDVI